MNSVLLGYDETEPSKRALERTAQIARAFGSKVAVASIAPVVESIGRSAGPIDPADPPEKHIAELGHAKEYLEREGVSAQYLTAVGEPADAIVQLAEDHHADLIVVGTRELGTLQRLLGQSVSDSVSHRAHCDVLIVH